VPQEQIQFLLGHSSIQTTEYLGGKQDIVNAVNDRIFARVKKFLKATASRANFLFAWLPEASRNSTNSIQQRYLYLRSYEWSKPTNLT